MPMVIFHIDTLSLYPWHKVTLIIPNRHAKDRYDWKTSKMKSFHAGRMNGQIDLVFHCKIVDDPVK